MHNFPTQASSQSHKEKLDSAILPKIYTMREGQLRSQFPSSYKNVSTRTLPYLQGLKKKDREKN